MAASIDPLTAARAEALFTSTLQVGAQLTLDEANAVIRAAVRAHGGTRGCAAEVAFEYGEHPDTAVSRMRWAREVATRLFTRRAWTRPAAPRPTVRLTGRLTTPATTAPVTATATATAARSTAATAPVASGLARGGELLRLAS